MLEIEFVIEINVVEILEATPVVSPDYRERIRIPLLILLCVVFGRNMVPLHRVSKEGIRSPGRWITACWEFTPWLLLHDVV